MDYFNVEYKDNSGNIINVDKVKRVKRKHLKDLTILQEDLVYQFLFYNAAVGDIIAEEKNWNTLVKICKMLPVVGREELGIDINKIEDDMVQLTHIFFTESTDEDGFPVKEDGWFKPSLLAKLHQLNYYGYTQESIKKLQIEVE